MMNPTENDPRTVDDVQLDLLVDGELNETERRQLLVSLDGIPDGWRHCALAFLEAQSWRADLLGVADRVDTPRAVAVPRLHLWPRGVRGNALAMAASFLIALVLGTYLHELLPLGDDAVPGPSQFAEAMPTIELPEAAPVEPDPSALASSTSSEIPWRMVSFPVAGDLQDGSASIQIPAAERDRLDEAWLNRQATGMPREVLEAIRKSGHDVRQRRQLVPLRLDDGRRMVVPVDDVEIHYVGGNPYQ